MRIVVILFALLISIASVAQKPQKPSKKDYVITIATSLGNVTLLLYDDTPKHKENFIKLTKDGTYNGTTFHRIIQGFMIQGGDVNSKDTDPNNDGMGNVGYTIPAEFNAKYTHVQGAVAAARMGDQVNPNKESSGCQFYIADNKDGAHFLDNSYTVFGQVIVGIDVVQKIATQPKNGRDRPLEDIKMTATAKLLKKKKITKIYGYKFS